MCQFFSAVVTKKEIIWDYDTDSHEFLIQKGKLKDLNTRINFVRVELVPSDGDIFNHKPSNWTLHVDQDLFPKWFDANWTEKEMRKIVRRVWRERFVLGQKMDLLGGGRIIRFAKDVEIGQMLGSSQVGKMRDSSRVGEMWDSSQVGEMLGSSQVGKMWGSSQVVEMWDSSQVVEMWGSSRVGKMWGSSIAVDFRQLDKPKIFVAKKAIKKFKMVVFTTKKATPPIRPDWREWIGTVQKGE